MDFAERFPKTWAVFDQGRAAGLHSAVQLWISRDSSILADGVLGGTSVDSSTIYPWLSSGKPLTAVAIGQLFERKLLVFDDPVARFIPEFAQNGKQAITLKHLLTHTGGFRSADALPPELPWDERIARICAAPVEPGWVPGERAGYHTTSSWYLLGEIVQRLTRRPFQEYVRDEVLLPLGMNHSWIGMPREQFRQYEAQGGLGTMFIAQHGELKPASALDSETAVTACRPGSNARGPIFELARLYRFLIGELTPTKHVLARSTIELMTRPHRVGIFDETFIHKIDLGLCFILNSNRYGAETVPYGYGRFASATAFGHSGSQSSCAFADPHHRLVIAWVFNAMCGERKHQRRARDFNSAIYEDLGIAG